MGKSNVAQQQADDKLLLLIEEQKQTKEGSPLWYSYQATINQLVAERFLEYVNS